MMNEVPIVTRTQRRAERRQMMVMLILVLAVTVASFFLGVMVGERGSLSDGQIASPRLPMAQVPPPPLPTNVSAAPQKLTFYDDLPKGNSAPLGSGINLPKGGYAAPPPAPVAAPASAPAAAPAPVASPPPQPAAVKEQAPPPAVPKAVAAGGFLVQVASTKDAAEAKRMVDKLKGAGFPATSERADLGAKGVWYRVTVGPYADRAAADKAAAQLKQQKYAPMVRAR